MLKTRIHKHEVGLLFRHGDFKRPLAPGSYWIFKGLLGLYRTAVEKVSVLQTNFIHPRLDIMIEDPRLREMLHVLELSETQRAIVWKDGRLYWIVGPGRYACWKHPYEIRSETFDVSDFKFDHPQIESIIAHPMAEQHLQVIRVASHMRVILFRDGEVVEQLGPGRHVFWKGAGDISGKAVDLREQVADVSGQEIMTADKVTLRVNLLVSYHVTDPLTAVTAVADFSQALYREAQLALREAVGTRQLDRLLADKDEVGREIRDAVVTRAGEFGLAVRSVGLRDIILPGDMKSILNQVIEAQKQSEANLIRRREETAAARSQANTAKLLADNPILARMKEFEALQEILRGAKTTFVLGGGDLGEQVRGLVTSNGGHGNGAEN